MYHEKTNLFAPYDEYPLGIASGLWSKKEEWKLVWQEEFDSGDIDTSTWTKVSRGTSDWCNYMAAHDTLYDVRDGNLILRGIVNTIMPADTAPFLTGED